MGATTSGIRCDNNCLLPPEDFRLYQEDNFRPPPYPEIGRVQKFESKKQTFSASAASSLVVSIKDYWNVHDITKRLLFTGYWISVAKAVTFWYPLRASVLQDR
ncbi:hypothetical protein K0M31_012747 [Melipona bicolor]|uniref:Uncharacterized protein n=1 Tax=Melipona bicolor TaxID=60889 RepID=A0AA40FJ28_9HYME|nr:hypothetical protein K0M31_012747 [Melipona bicolor]